MTNLDFSARWRDAVKVGIPILKDHTKTQHILALAHALNGPSLKYSYERLLTTTEGGEIACNMPEFTELYSKLPDCAPGTVGNLLFIGQQYSLETIIKISQRGKRSRTWINMKHPYVWMARRYRDTHDVWHTITGYNMDFFGEICLAAFSYAQTGAYQWGAISLMGIGKLITSPRKLLAIVEAYRRGKQCNWLLAENYEKLIYEDINECRKRLNLHKAKRYEKACKN
jgi:ubiquinone biosynthesis protein COQ4